MDPVPPRAPPAQALVASEAVETYRAALAGGLDSTTYVAARRRFAELLRSSGAAALEP